VKKREGGSILFCKRKLGSDHNGAGRVSKVMGAGLFYQFP